jgi:uncharacterized protein (DUF486 family)
MKIWVAVATLLVLILCSVGMAFMSMVLANGFMSNTDQMAISYVVCNGLSVLALSVFSGWLAYVLNKRLNLNTWLGGLATVTASMMLFGISMFVAFFLIVSIFGS